MYGCKVSVSEIPLAADALREHRPTDQPDASGCEFYPSTLKRGFVVDGKELERDCQAVGK